MIEKHRERLRALSDEELSTVAQAINSPGELLIEDITHRGLGQADVVMALLKSSTVEARRIIGRLTSFQTIPTPSPWPKPYPPTRRKPLRVTAMRRNLRLNRVGQEALRVTMGMTLRDVLEAGVAVCDVMGASRNGLVRFSCE